MIRDLLSKCAVLFAASCCVVALGGRTASAAGVPVVEANPYAPRIEQVVVLYGRVTSAGKPVARAELRLVQGSRTVANTLSRADGTYRFANPGPDSGVPPTIAAGVYTLESQYRITLGAPAPVRIVAGTTVRKDVELGTLRLAGGAPPPAPRTTLVVTGRTVGTPNGPLNTAFSNERPVAACMPAPACALHYGIVRANGPALGVVESLGSFDDFMTAMHGAYPSASSATIYVHGFNNGFEDPTRLAAGAVAALVPAGVPIAYSWPSKHATVKYIDDETNNGWDAEHFRDFLVALLSRPDAPQTVNILAHSMGNRPVVAALVYLARAKPALAGHIGQVVLAAPDVDAATFWEAVPTMAQAAIGITVYGSSHDEALQLSRLLHGHCRAGLIGCNDALAGALTPLSNLNVIDASYFKCDMLGHGYWSSSTTMLRDIGSLMNAGTMVPGTTRPNLAPTATSNRYRFISAQADDGGCAAQPHA